MSTAKKIMEATCKQHGVSVKEVQSTSRSRHIAAARRAAACALKAQTKLSTPEIGALLNRHHATVLYLLKTPKKRNQKNAKKSIPARGKRT